MTRAVKKRAKAKPWSRLPARDRAFVIEVLACDATDAEICCCPKKKKCRAMARAYRAAIEELS